MKEFFQRLEITYKNLGELKANPKNAKTHSKKQVHQIAQSIKVLGFNNPVLIEADGTIIAGHGRVEAAKELGFESVPTICLAHMTPEQVRAYIIADNRLAEKSGWDNEILKIELDFLMNLDSELGFDATITGFEIPDIDLIVNPEAIEEAKAAKDLEEDFFNSVVDIPQQVKKGELWKLGEHLVYCGDALHEKSYKYLMENAVAEVAFVDYPYNVAVDGHICGKGKTKHEEFAMASGEMSKLEFTNFLKEAMDLQIKYSKNGSIHFGCMDWRHITEIMNAANASGFELKNLCIWDKGTGGMGSLYRSQHELIFVLKNGTAPHVNNVELGVHGRYRTNIWKYRGMHASNPESKILAKLHPTVKPVAMIMDALLDCSSPGGIVLDSFGGSGSTLIAAERTKRKARIIEIEPKYCDVILYRWEKFTGKKAELIENKGD